MSHSDVAPAWISPDLRPIDTGVGKIGAPIFSQICEPKFDSKSPVNSASRGTKKFEKNKVVAAVTLARSLSERRADLDLSQKRTMEWSGKDQYAPAANDLGVGRWRVAYTISLRPTTKRSHEQSPAL
jgi:hypothetical protein